MKLKQETLAKLRRADEHFDAQYGKPGTPSRLEFDSKALAWYYCEILRDKRKELKLTQKQLAEQVGKKREYISQIERGELDMQLSVFINLSQALGLNLSVA